MWLPCSTYSHCIQQVLEGVNHCHQNGIIHRDLKVVCEGRGLCLGCGLFLWVVLHCLLCTFWILFSTFQLVVFVVLLTWGIFSTCFFRTVYLNDCIWSRLHFDWSCLILCFELSYLILHFELSYLISWSNTVIWNSFMFAGSNHV